MISNPLQWFNKAVEYAEPKQNTLKYGELFLISDNAPKDAKSAFAKYIDLMKKVIMSWDFVIFNDNHEIAEFQSTTSKEKEQSEIILQLIERGYLNNTPFF